jgi:hypothetical protein
MATGTWLLFQSFGSLGAGIIAQTFGGYGAIGPLGLGACLIAIATAWPLARRFDRERPAAILVPSPNAAA